MAGLLHDVGHGPFGHFFDEHFLRTFGLTHETLGGHIITHELGDLLRQLRGCPNRHYWTTSSSIREQIAWLITRPHEGDQQDQPRWLVLLRSLLSGIYTIDNMDFVLRDAYMSGYSQRSFDLDRLLHYSFFSEHGLTIHDRGMNALMRFMAARAELFRSIYFHRTVRAIDLTLADLFADSRRSDFSGQSAGASGPVSGIHGMVVAGRRFALAPRRTDMRDARAGRALAATVASRDSVEDGGAADAGV